ncbi:DUF5686 and carboxypeptidase regulatory-like domain-containing protein [Pararhodonellum marinum]|uniref:DUF5686 and carboxypeptidase regulatory-like domain-containing protein n=1 Tax=Pararhodonellum marinum TaxID=2755358 RepID=UPI00188DDAFD|nr:DUF5686 and carboxypeptidase regulatory-like domain-containing protein [Pararhodonellum marinum]
MEKTARFTFKSLVIYFAVLLSSFGYFNHDLLAQGIRGKVTNSSGDPIPFATVFVRNLNNGVPTNLNGDYEYRLPSGLYDVVFQSMGFASQLKTVEIDESWVNLDVNLDEQVYALQEVTVRSGQEDPALTIMRRAISKAKFHRLQVQEYSMRVYIKGTGELTNAPFFLKKKLKEEGLNLNEAYTSESVSEITVTLPNKIEEKVISIRTNGDNNATSPAPYIGASFYNDKINESISPLSRAAFAYYRFRYEGSFFEGDVLVNKIRVIPRAKGERVFDGYLYIIEDLWAIHSLDLKTSLFGFEIRVNQQYAPVAENVWMPTTHTYNFGGKFFGFAGEFRYLASTSDYQITLNEDLVVETEIIDEKIDEVPEDVVAFQKNASALDQLADADKMTRKDFRKMINEYEKETLKERKDNDIILETAYKVDSLARKRGLSYWDSIRPVKLTDQEIKGYSRDDSLATAEAAEMSDNDSTIQKAKRKFNPLDVLTGGNYAFGKGRSLGFVPNTGKMSFNTVEGFKVGLEAYYRWRKEEKQADSVSILRKTFEIRPEFRYGFASQQAYGTLNLDRLITLQRNATRFGVTGGSFIYQYNRENPISEWVNAGYSILLRQNFMKLFEQDFVNFYFIQRRDDVFTYRVNMEFAERREVFNNSRYSFYNREGREFSPNRPENIEADPIAFANHQAMTLNASFDWRPGMKYMIRNGRKIPLTNTAPLIKVKYRKGIPGFLPTDATADFDHLDATVEHFFNFGVSGKLEFKVNGGTFLNQNQVYFMDFKHFGGNRTIFSDMGAASNYRFLDYYQYSTSGGYVGSIVHYQFRKFLLTQLPELRFSGVRENIFFNYLKTENSPHYWELGYSLDNLFRIFRVEFGAGFENGSYATSGIRLGIATFITVN